MNDQGKPPKSADAIRSQLESIRRTAGVVRQQGPINEQNQDSREIVVASFYDHHLGRKFQNELRSRGLFSSASIENRKLVISVDYPDAKIAGEVSTKFRALNPDRRHAVDSSRYDWMIFGGLIGLAIGIVFAIDADNRAYAVAFVLAVTGICSAAGHLVDRTNLAEAKKRRLGLWEFLVFVGILGMVVIATQALPLLFKVGQ